MGRWVLVLSRPHKSLRRMLTSCAFVENRDQRVDSWRDFAKGKPKKKKTKVAVLG